LSSLYGRTWVVWVIFWYIPFAMADSNKHRRRKEKRKKGGQHRPQTDYSSESCEKLRAWRITMLMETNSGSNPGVPLAQNKLSLRQFITRTLYQVGHEFFHTLKK